MFSYGHLLGRSAALRANSLFGPARIKEQKEYQPYNLASWAFRKECIDFQVLA